MPLKPKVSKLEEVEEKYRELYEPEMGSDGQATGHYIVSIVKEGGYELANTQGLMNALSAEREQNKQYKTQLAQFEGVDPAKFRSLQDENEQLKAANPNEQEIEKLVEQRVEPYKVEIGRQLETFKTEASKQLEDRETANSKLKSQLQKTLVTDFAMKVASQVSANPALLAPLLERNIRADFEGDVARSVIVDANGNPRLSSKDINSPMSEMEWAEEIKKNPEFAPLIKTEGKPGTGSPQPTNGKLPDGAIKFSDAKTPKEKTEAIRARMAAKGG